MTTVRRLAAVTLLTAGVFEAGLLVRARMQPPFASIKVRWDEAVTGDQRSDLERQLGLRQPSLDGGRTWSYRIDNLSQAHVAAIVGHPSVEDTAYVDRTTMTAERLSRTPAPPLPWPIVLLRQGLWALAAGAAVAGTSFAAAAARDLRGLARFRGSAAPVFASVLASLRWLLRPAVAPMFGAFRRLGRPAQAAVMFAAGLLPAAAVSVVADAAHPEWRAGSIYQRGIPLPAADEFLSQDPELIDHDVYYHGLYGWVEHARRADVIFTGNSRAVYAFRQEALQHHFDRLGLKYYSLAFAGGADQFPLTLMRRYGVWPKVLVVNVHGFFNNDLTRFGQWAMERDGFAGWNFVKERQASWLARSALHRWLPHWPAEIVYRKSVQVIYRNVTNGSWRWVVPVIEPKPLGNYPVARTADENESADIDRWTRRITERAPGFLREAEAHGTRVVLVYVPWTDPVAFYSARNSAAALGKPLVVAWPDGLMGAVGSHIGLDSARRYVDALMPKLLALPEFQAILPDAARSGE